jgi:hypothetical protein
MRPLKWTIEAVSREFKQAQNTVRKILNQGGAEPSKDGTYSTEQVTACLFGNLHAEKIRKERELVRKYRLENEITESAVVNKSEALKGLALIADEMTSIILRSALSQSEKEDLQRALSSVPVVCEDAARRMTRLRRNGSGKTPENGESES